MSSLVRQLRSGERRAWAWSIAALTLLGAVVLGPRASQRWLVLLFAEFAGLALVTESRLGLLGIIAAALVVPLEISTGTEVKLNAATLLIPALFAWWLLQGMGKEKLHWAASRVNRPLILFLISGLLSLLIGNVFWDLAIPKSSNFWLVQLSQWAIFAFAALAFWLTANMIQSEDWLKRLTWFFLYLGGGLAILLVLPGIRGFVREITTVTMIRAPFWTLLAALAGGLLLFDHELHARQRGFLIATLVAVFVYAFIQQREAASNWVGVAATAGALIWLRFPKFRGAIVAIAIIMAMTGILFPSIYEFAGGDDEWTESGGSRLALIERVVQVTLRNPITGLGPASYRAYAGVVPLRYRTALWINPKVNSHNNYVDLFAHTGILGLCLFLWHVVDLGLLGLQLSSCYCEGFVSGYVNGALAAWVGSLVIMMLADWILPFIYNIGFPGFQASLLVWLFLGGLVAVDQWYKEAPNA